MTVYNYLMAFFPLLGIAAVAGVVLFLAGRERSNSLHPGE